MSFPWPSGAPTAAHRASYAGAVVRPVWFDSAGVAASHAPLSGHVDADLCVVGGGFTGLWAAVLAKRADPGRDVVLLEADCAAFGSSGRSGGFLEASLTHGLANGEQRFPGELATIERLAAENLAGLRADLATLDVACDLEDVGTLQVALEPHELEALSEDAERHRRHGYHVELLDAAAARREVASPTYQGALWIRSGSLVVDPAKLALGLRDAAARLGVRMHERSRVEAVSTEAGAVVVKSAAGAVRAARVLLATGAYRGLHRAMRRYVAPVYDYVLATEPFSAAQREAVGWRRRQGIADSGNQFHYYRLTADGRIVWGGYDAVYRFGGPVGTRLDDHDASFARLAQHFFTTFPQLEGVRFSHRWGGPIDTCSRFSAFFGTAHRGRLAYVAGYTGLGIGATRFGAQTALDLLDGRATVATGLEMVRRRPVPFPPEPLRFAVIQLTRNRLAAADRDEGRRGLWLRTLDRLELGFDS